MQKKHIFIFLFIFLFSCSAKQITQNTEEIEKIKASLTDMQYTIDKYNIILSELSVDEFESPIKNQNFQAEKLVQKASLSSTLALIPEDKNLEVKGQDPLESKIIPIENINIQEKNSKDIAKEEDKTPSKLVLVEVPDKFKQSELEVDDKVAYKEAYSTFLDKNYKEARALFEKFISNYPQSPFADNAVYWLGETYYVEKDFNNAILQFRNVLEKYPKGNKTPDAFLKIAYSYYNLNNKDRSVFFLKELIKNYPYHPVSNKAQKMLDSMQ